VQIHEGNKHGNITKEVTLESGDVEKAFAASDYLVEDDYEFHGTATRRSRRTSPSRAMAPTTY